MGMWCGVLVGVAAGTGLDMGISMFMSIVGVSVVMLDGYALLKYRWSKNTSTKKYY
jgi:hypothetical protein